MCCNKCAGLKVIIIIIFYQPKGEFEMTTLRPARGYAPCGSASVITLLQKYRFPLSPSNTTPGLTHTLHTPTNKQTSLTPPLLSGSSQTHFHLDFTFVHSASPSPPLLLLEQRSGPTTTKFTSSFYISSSSSSSSPWCQGG